MAKAPKITVITPSYNQVSYLEDTIRSVLTQNYPSLEYMVIDGGSNDGSVDVIRKYSSDLAYSISERDSGQAAAINKGLDRATGDILCWLNSDDMFEPAALAKVADLYASPGFAFLYGDGYVFRHREGSRRRKRPGRITPQELMVRDRILQPSTFWTRQVHQDIGKLDESLHYALDWDFFIRVSRRFEMTYAPIPFSTYRIHSAHKTATGGRRRAEEVAGVVERYAPREWRDAFSEILRYYDEIAAATKPQRILRAARFIVRRPAIAFRHGLVKWAVAIAMLSANGNREGESR